MEEGHDSADRGHGVGSEPDLEQTVQSNEMSDTWTLPCKAGPTLLWSGGGAEAGMTEQYTKFVPCTVKPSPRVLVYYFLPYDQNTDSSPRLTV